MKSSTTMTRASDRWFGADAGGKYFEDAFVLFDEEAATCAHRSIGGGVAGRAGRATASLETYAATISRTRGRARGGASEDSSAGEDGDVYGMDGDFVPRDAPVVMCVGRRLRDAAEDVRASVEGAAFVPFPNPCQKTLWTNAALEGTFQPLLRELKTKPELQMCAKDLLYDGWQLELVEPWLAHLW